MYLHDLLHSSKLDDLHPSSLSMDANVDVSIDDKLFDHPPYYKCIVGSLKYMFLNYLTWHRLHAKLVVQIYGSIEELVLDRIKEDTSMPLRYSMKNEPQFNFTFSVMSTENDTL